MPEDTIKCKSPKQARPYRLASDHAGNRFCRTEPTPAHGDIVSLQLECIRARKIYGRCINS